MNCICGSNNYRLVFNNLKCGNEGQIVECLSCGLYRTIPAPSKGYRKEGDYEKWMREEPQILKKRRYKYDKKLAGIIKRKAFPTSASNILEIGCSTGHLVRYLKDEGLNCFGLDMDISAIQYGRSNFNLNNLIIGNATAIPFAENTLDILILNHTLEHLDDPLKFLGQAQKALRAGGYLFIIVPNHRGLLVRLRPLSWSGWLTSAHFWHFTSYALCKLLRNSGFEIISLKLTRIHTPLITSIIKRIAYDILSKFAYTFGLGDEIFVASQKKY